MFWLYRAVSDTHMNRLKLPENYRGGVQTIGEGWEEGETNLTVNRVRKLLFVEYIYTLTYAARTERQIDFCIKGKEDKFNMGNVLFLSY